MVVQHNNGTEHPSALWARRAEFSPCQVDCTTAVALKILDNKCKMLPGEKHAVFAIYDVVKQRPAELFDQHVHALITRARGHNDTAISRSIHQLRIDAERRIPKPVMKAYKAFLRDGLFG